MKKFYLFTLVGMCLVSSLMISTNNRSFSAKNLQKDDAFVTRRLPIDVDEKIILRIKNMEDYIYMTDEDKDIFLHQFEQYADSMGYHNVEVVYSTTDTNETLYTQLLTGKSSYDLICPSEYMIQKMIREDLIVKLDRRSSLLPNYDAYASAYIRHRFDSIATTDINNNPVTLGEYGVGYMWGTLGVLFNPQYANYNPNQAVMDAAAWDILWNPDYNGTISIKDSMRDTYAMAVLQANKDELVTYRQQYENSEITAQVYNEKIAEVINRCDSESIKEVDSGKSDIVSGKIGINLAWSGDAVYSMQLGDEENKELCYSIPLLGSNLWFDAWVMPKTERTALQEEVAYLFLDFLSIPEYARENMEYTGYTSFIGGEEIRDLVRDWYDVRAGELQYCTDEENEIYASVYRLNPANSLDYTALAYEDFLTSDHQSAFDAYPLVYFTEDEDGNIIDESDPQYIKLLDENGEETTVDKTYGDLTIVDDLDSGLEDVDLNYFFNNEYVNDETSDLPEYHFYSDCYFYSYEKDGAVYQSEAVGREFYCQYPDLETITRCAVMKDFGAQASEAVLAMWERFKTTSLPSWAVIVFIIEIVGGAGLITYLIINKKLKYRLRQKRKQAKQNN